MSNQKPTDKAPDEADSSPADPGDALLSRSIEMLRPLVDLLMAQGIGYPSLSRALRTTFVEAARDQLARENTQLTDAAVSLRSGVHRKEVKAVNEARSQPAELTGNHDQVIHERSLSIAEQVYTRWTTDATYRDTASQPATLPISGKSPSFESLVASVTRDFSRRTILDELVRLEMVNVDQKRVTPLAPAMVPPQAWNELAQYLGDHVHDHLAAGAANLNAARQGKTAPFLEHSMYADGISDLSIEQLGALAREVWKPAFNQMVGTARQRYELDRNKKHQGRMRFGVYFYSERDEPLSGSDEIPQTPAPKPGAKARPVSPGPARKPATSRAAPTTRRRNK